MNEVDSPLTALIPVGNGIPKKIPSGHSNKIVMRLDSIDN